MAEIKIELVPFSVPNYVLVKMPPARRQDGFTPDGPKYALADLDNEVLSALCREFRAKVFEKAGKDDPAT